MGPNGLIVAIDGPAGAGKSTVARELARRLGYVYVDTGAMYRVVGLLAREAAIDPADADRLGEVARSAAIRFELRPDGTQGVFSGPRDVTQAIRGHEISQWASKVSAQAPVRQELVALQRRLGKDGGVVLEGRDIGTVVFPDADVKFFLDASAGERGQRRWRELAARNEKARLADIVADIEERDRRDRSRAHSPLRPADDAERVDTTAMSAEEVLEHLEARCRAKLPQTTRP
jgi:cytidylate kinase